MNLARGNQSPTVADTTTENQTSRSRHPARRGRFATSLGAGMLAGTTLLAACGGAGSAESGHTSNTNSQPTNAGEGSGEISNLSQPTEPSGSIPVYNNPPIRVTFDSRAGSHVTSGFSNVIYVYPGPLKNHEDKTENGTFENDQTAEAICVTTGRTVHADTKVGERPGQSDKWVELTTGYFATELYLQPNSELAQLPQCQGVS